MKSLVVIFFIFLLTISASAQLTWERLPGPDGTWFIQCITSDAGHVYVGTPDGGGMYVSSDSGNSWHSANIGLPVNETIQDIEVSGSLVFAILDSIYKSTDNGSSWETLPNSPDGITNLHVASGGVLYAGSDLALGGQGIYKSTDNGDTWTQVSNGLPSYVVFFTYYRNVSAITSDGLGYLYCSVGGSASTEAGVYRSTDDGANWVRMSTGLLANSGVKPVKASPNGRLYVGVKNRIYTSTDTAGSWVQTDSLPMSTSALIKAIDFNILGDVFVGTTSGLFRGAEGGTGWTKLGGSTLGAVSIYDVHLASGGMVFSGGLELWGARGGHFRSTDNGDNWAESNVGMNNGRVAALAISPGGRIYTGNGRGTVEYSSDGGNTFSRASVPYTGSNSFATIVALAANTNEAVVAGNMEGMFTSADSGANWTKTLVGFDSRGATTDASGNFYAATSAGVYTSTNDGTSWTSTGGGGNSYSVFVTAAGTILSGTYNSGVERTTNGGTDWTNSGTSLFGTVTIGKFVQLDNGTIYTSALLAMFRSTDDGATWSGVTTTPPGQQIRTIAASGGTLFMGSPSGLYQSTDGANTWDNYGSGLLWTFLDYLAVSPDGHLFGSGGTGLYRTPETLTTSVEEISAALPESFSISQNYPNPFNPSTSIDFSLPVRSEVEVSVYNTLGERIATLFQGVKEAGVYRTTWDAAGVSSGVYFYTVRASSIGNGSNGFTTSRKMILMK